MATYNRFLNNLSAYENLVKTHIQSSIEPEQKENMVQQLVRARSAIQQVIPHNICSPNFMETFFKHVSLFGSVPQLEFCQIQALLSFQTNRSYSSQEIKDFFFKRNIQTQKQQHLQRISNANLPFLEWPNLQRGQTYDIVIPNKDLGTNGQAPIQIKRQELLCLKENKVIPQRIITNFFTILRQTKRLAEDTQIAPFSFMTTLQAGLSEDEENDSVILSTVAKNFRKAAKCLKSNLYQQHYTAIPMLVGGHYSMMLVKGMARSKGSAKYQPNLIYCSSRRLATKELFSVMKAYLQCEARDFREEVTLNVRDIYSTQLLLPRQVLAADSGLFLMLYCQYLLGAGNERQLNEIVPANFHSKLHIFPSSLVYEMRAMIWNFYCKMVSVKNSKYSKNGSRLNIIDDYFAQIKAYEKKASFEYDYCKLEARQVAKWALLIGEKAIKSEQELLYRWGLEYFYHSGLNYYEGS